MLVEKVLDDMEVMSFLPRGIVRNQREGIVNILNETTNGKGYVHWWRNETSAERYNYHNFRLLLDSPEYVKATGNLLFYGHRKIHRRFSTIKSFELLPGISRIQPALLAATMLAETDIMLRETFQFYMPHDKHKPVPFIRSYLRGLINLGVDVGKTWDHYATLYEKFSE